MNLALYQPDIPQNTGTILRMAACLGVTVEVIGPAGFDLSGRALRRAGLDYLEHVRIVRHAAFAEEFETLLGSKREVSEEVGASVAAILNDVRLRGDEAVLAYTAKFDQLPLTPATLAFSAEEIDAAEQAISG